MGNDDGKKSNDRFLDNFKSIKNALKRNKPLTLKQKQWLYRQRRQYLNRDLVGYEISDQQIKSLDTLIPLLGRDWKVSNPKPPMEQTLMSIFEQLKNKQELDQKQTKWLHKLEHTLRNSTDPDDKLKKEILDECSKYLPYNWRVRSFSQFELIFEAHYDRIKSTVEQGKEILPKDKKWLRSQKHRFRAQNNVRISNFEMERLYELKELLNLDWTAVPKKEVNENENPRVRKQVEKWVIQFSPYLNFTKLEQKYGMPKGKLQKFVKYSAKLEYKWILALKDFKSMIRK